MKSLLSKFYNSATPSFIFLALPYLVKNFSNLYQSDYYSHYKYALVILGLIFFQVLISAASEIKNRKLDIGVIFVYVSFLMFLYGADIINLINELQRYLFGYQKIRGRIVYLPLTLVFFIVISFLWFKRKEVFLILNYFCGIITFLTLFNISFPSKKSEAKEFLNKYQKVDTKLAKNKPVVLVILDEYASPIELFKVNADSSLFDFSNQLKQRKWVVKDSFYSNETFTIYSLGSLFSYNISGDSTFRKYSSAVLGSRVFKKSTLADSLKTKEVYVVNNGIFDFGCTKPLTRICFVPRNFIEVLLSSSIIPSVYLIIDRLKLQRFNDALSPYEVHNIQVISKFKNLVNSSKKTFLYYHLLMPHDPLEYASEFTSRPLTTNNYVDFWYFTNRKVYQLLEILTQNEGYKVILTSDHGFRNDSVINPHNTFAAFYGFDSATINQIHSVQDLGSLINSQFDQ